MALAEIRRVLRPGGTVNHLGNQLAFNRVAFGEPGTHATGAQSV